MPPERSPVALVTMYSLWSISFLCHFIYKHHANLFNTRTAVQTLQWSHLNAF